MKNKYLYITFTLILLSYLSLKNNLPDFKVTDQIPSPKKYQRIHHSQLSLSGAEKIITDETMNSRTKQKIFNINSNNITNSSQIPWEDIQQLWIDELSVFITSVDPVEGEAILQTFLKEKARFNEEEKIIGRKLEKMWQQKPLNRDLQNKLAAESADAIDRYRNNAKKIFGKHYQAIHKFSEEFNQSIQVYSRDMPVSVEIAF